MKPPVAKPIVLVVEDEMVLRMRAVDIVEDAGFVPVEAVSADEAIQILESRDDISLLFTDIQMPGSMDGLKLAHATHARWPHIKIILVSGQIEVTDADKPDDSRFFPKPLEIEQMVRELQAMIGNGALKVMPSLTAADEALTKENQELRNLLQQAGIDAKALLRKTVLDTEKQQSIIDENQPFQDALTTENDSLKLALEQAGIDANALLVQSGIDAEERDAADKLQHLIHTELHHRIKNMLATVGAITNQSLRTATSLTHASSAIDGRFAALARAHDLLTRVSWDNATIDSTIRSAIEPFDQGGGRFVISGEDIRITSSSVIAFAMTLNELVHQHHQVRRLDPARGPGPHILADRGRSAALRMGRIGRPGGERADAQELRDADDDFARPAAEGQGRARLQAERIRLHVGGAARRFGHEAEDRRGAAPA